MSGFGIAIEANVAKYIHCVVNESKVIGGKRRSDRAVLAQGVGDVVMIDTRSKLDGFAVCMTGPGSEGGAKTCYVKFGMARGGNGPMPVSIDFSRD